MGRLDFSRTDVAGMNCLHHEARAVHFEVVMCILQNNSELGENIIYLARQPAGWTPLICLADVPRAKSDAAQETHAETIVRDAQNMRAGVPDACHVLWRHCTSRGGLQGAHEDAGAFAALVLTYRSFSRGASTSRWLCAR